MPEIKEQEKKKTKTTTAKKGTTSKKSPAKKTNKEAPKKKNTKTAKPTDKKVNTTTSKVEIKEPKKIIIEEIDLEKEPIKEPIIIPTQKKEKIKEDNLFIKDENNKGAILLLIIMLIIFGLGMFYIYDYYNKSEEKNKNDINIINEDKIDLEGNNSSKTSTNEEYINIEKITLTEYQQKNNNKEKMIVIIASKYCSSCKTYEPVINKVLNKKNLKAYKIDVSEIEKKEDKELFKSLFEVSVTPTTFIIENGTSKASVMGYTSEESISSWIDKNY